MVWKDVLGHWGTVAMGVGGGRTANNNWACFSFAEPLDMEDLTSGLGVTKQDVGQGKGPMEGGHLQWHA